MDIVHSVVDRNAKAFPVDFAVSEFDIDTPDEQMRLIIPWFITYMFSPPRFKRFPLVGAFGNTADGFRQGYVPGRLVFKALMRLHGITCGSKSVG